MSSPHYTSRKSSALNAWNFFITYKNSREENTICAMWVLSRAVKALRFLLSFLPRKLACHSLRDASRKHESPGSERKDISRSRQGVSISVLVHWAPSSAGQYKEGQVTGATHRWLCYRRKTLRRESQKLPYWAVSTLWWEGLSLLHRVLCMAACCSRG